jgi:hypothetical protein
MIAPTTTKHAVDIYSVNALLAEEGKQKPADNCSHNPQYDVEHQTLALLIDYLTGINPAIRPRTTNR